MCITHSPLALSCYHLSIEPATYRIRHVTRRSTGMCTVAVLPKPLSGDSLRACPTCAVIHRVKTVHVWLDSDGVALVSRGVLADLRLAGAVPYPSLPPGPNVVFDAEPYRPTGSSFSRGLPPGIRISSRATPTRLTEAAVRAAREDRLRQDQEARRKVLYTGGSLARSS